MSHLRSHLSPRIVLALFVVVLGGSLLTLGAAGVSRTELGTADQQAAVRTSRDVTTLPIRSTCTVVPEKELFVTDLSVVEDCLRTTWGPCVGISPAPATQGAWTFGTRMASVAGTTDPATLSTFTLNWLHSWSNNQTINGDLVPARPNIQSVVIDPWLAASGGKILDMKKAPFRLLAIVARLDLRQNAGYSGGTSAGEGRFVYGLIDANGNPLQFLVIFEYGLDAANCTAVLAWANLWHGLGSNAFGPAYNAALQGVTDRFATIGASPGKPNGSAINQVRSDEVQLVLPGSTLWELREFKPIPNLTLPAGSIAPLTQNTVAQTPARSLNQTTAISTFVNTNAAAILANNYVVPLSWNGAPFRGGAAPNHLELGWDGPLPVCSTITNPNARFSFSVNTCSGCHGLPETGTTFKQVEPRAAGAVSTLSGFLTGINGVPDFCGISHNFNDIDRRRVDLCQLLGKTCTQVNSEPVISFVH
ncbi:MAG TPA: hypothetical protein VF173_01365 [Thermoanaerobaculia bacterium]|nr:hypothetical protein [Thermoanaerobaculia bacterium]